MGFNNILETVSYIMRMLTYDNWSEAFIVMMASDTNGGLFLLLFIPAIILSVIIHGLIIANFFNTMMKLRNKEADTVQQYKSIVDFGKSLMNFIREVGFVLLEIHRGEEKRSEAKLQGQNRKGRKTSVWNL